MKIAIPALAHPPFPGTDGVDPPARSFWMSAGRLPM